MGVMSVNRLAVFLVATPSNGNRDAIHNDSKNEQCEQIGPEQHTSNLSVLQMTPHLIGWRYYTIGSDGAVQRVV